MISVTVIGSGALGKFYGGLLTLAGCDVCYLERSDFAIIQEQKFYEIELPDTKVIQIKPNQIEKDYRLLPKSDIVIVALKTTDNHLLKKFLPPTLKPESKLLILQNGIGNEEYLSTFINTEIICGVTSIGATRIRPGYIKVKHLGELNLAPFNKQPISSCEYIKQQLAGESLANPFCPPIRLFENHRIIRWSKLLWNTPFSSLSILLNVPVDVLATQKQYQDIVRAVMNEVCLVAKQDGAEIEDKIEKLIALTETLKGYYPSMYYDFKNGRPIESQYIVFNVLDYARLHQLNLPLLSVIHESLNLLEQKEQWFATTEQNHIISLLMDLIDAKKAG